MIRLLARAAEVFHDNGGHRIKACGEHCLYCCPCTECVAERGKAFVRCGVTFPDPRRRRPLIRDGRLWLGTDLSIYVDPRDTWVGAYHDDERAELFVCLVPCLVIRSRGSAALLATAMWPVILAAGLLPYPFSWWIGGYLCAMQVAVFAQAARRTARNVRRLTSGDVRPGGCPSRSPESDTPCALDDTAAAHRAGHEGRRANGALSSWPTDFDDYERWGS